MHLGPAAYALQPVGKSIATRRVFNSKAESYSNQALSVPVQGVTWPIDLILAFLLEAPFQSAPSEFG